MDFNDTPEEAAYRAKVRQWLEKNAPSFVAADQGDMERGGSEMLVRARGWQARKSEAGYAQITWPKEWGGGGGTPIQAVIYSQEEARFPGLPGNAFGIGLYMCIPTVMAVADEETKKRFVGPAVRGEEIWCQLFSEPSGGSDLAAARTRAVRDGDEWVINGQKIWTSGAQNADFGMIIARTNPEVPKHKGMTMFWLDMRTPGVEVRPIHQMSGASGFNEVFFTDVRIKDSQRLGKVDDGWNVSIVTLMNERASVGAGFGGPNYRDILKLAREMRDSNGRPLLQDQSVREKIAEWYTMSEGLSHTAMRALTALSRGQTPGPEQSISKPVVANMNMELDLIGVESADQFGLIEEEELSPVKAMFQHALLGSPGLRIAGGTDEILKNVIAERVLGLPQDIRVDKNVPFKDHPTGR